MVRALDELGYELAGDELAGLTPTLFEHVDPLGTYDFSSDRLAGPASPPPRSDRSVKFDFNDLRRFRLGSADAPRSAASWGWDSTPHQRGVKDGHDGSLTVDFEAGRTTFTVRLALGAGC